MSHLLSIIQANHLYNVNTVRQQPLSELSGALGDLGILLPIMLALTQTHSISLSSTLVFTGLANIMTGILFGIPLPVQPMKAIAAIAIAEKYSIHENMAAGLTVAAVILALSVTGLLKWVSNTVPIPVVKGIQVGAGLSLVISAGTSLLQPLSWAGPNWADNHLWSLLAFCLLLVTTAKNGGARARIPFALFVVTLGLGLAGIRLRQRHQSIHDISMWRPSLYIPLRGQFWSTLSASLGQLPLTTLNSIIAVSHLSRELLPHVNEPSPTAIGMSVACMNMISCWFGAMPTCHGSGGLAAQFRFGARSGASIIILGLIKLLCGLFIGDALMDLLKGFPNSLLGIMVVAAGVELAKVGESLNVGARDLWEESSVDGGSSSMKPKTPSEDERRERWSVMMITVAALLAFKNDAVGFLAGMLWHVGLHAGDHPAVRTLSRFANRRHFERDQETEPLL